MAIFTKFAYFCLLFASFETVFGAAPSSHTTTTTTGPNSSTGGNDPRTIVVTSDRTQTKFITLSIADTKTVTTTVVLTSVVTSAQTTRETELITTTQIEAANSLRITVTQTVTATLVQTSRITALETATLDHTLSNVQTAVVTDTFTTTATEISSDLSTTITTATTTLTETEAASVTAATPSATGCPCLANSQSISGVITPIGATSRFQAAIDVFVAVDDLCSCCEVCTTLVACFAFGISHGACLLATDMEGTCPQAAGFNPPITDAAEVWWTGGCSEGMPWVSL